MTEFIFKKSIARIFIIIGIFFSITAFSNKHTEILVDSNFSFPLEKTVNKSIENIAPIIEGNRYSNFELLDEDASVLLGLSGKVFEDINYGGGNGRTYAAANASAQSSGWTAGEIAVENAIVELYDGAGNYISNTTTDATGGYTFTGIVDGTYQIRVVNNSVASNRGSNSTGQTIVPVQTFRTNGTSDVLNEVGGRSPNLIDAAANTTGASLSTLSTSSTDAQSVTLVNLNDTNTTEVNFGYNFDTVVNTNDSGQGSLRQFVLNSNELTNNNLNQEDTPTNGVNFPKDLEWETSIFMIPGSGLHKIDLSSELALIRDNQTHITGYTQQGSAQGTNANRVITIEIDGNTVLYDGLRIFADDVQISGLSIHTFRTSIYSYKNASTNTFIWGNYIGTEADGETIASTFSGTGISLYNVDDSFIGTNGDNVNDANEGNVVSNSYDGISIRSTSNVLVAGNYVGTDKTGSIDLGNRFKGIFLRDPAGTNIVGFDDTAINTNAADFRNVSSGNGNDGIRLLNGDNQVLAGNYLGTDATGTFAITNVNYGIQIQGNVNNLIIGTDSDGDDDVKERNVMSGNGSGMRFLGGTTGTNNRVSGNFIGTDATGNIAVPNLNNGLNINGPIGGVVVGTNADGINDEIERNVISGNGEDGIRLSDTNDNLIAGNNIGVAYNGLPLGNEKRGILIATSASYNTIGYSPTMTNANELVVGNNIKYNDDSAVAISDTGVGNRISRNQFDANEGIGIDLDYDLVTANDNGDGDSGPNELLNFPVFESSEVIGNDLVIFGYAPAGAEIEFFLADNGPNPNPLPSDYTNSFGEGAVYLFTAFEGGSLDTDGSTNSYVDDGTGATNTKVQNRFRFTIDTTGLNLVQGTLITSTATNTANSTSEFSGWTEVIYIEVCGDGIDNDNNGLTDCADPEADCPGPIVVAGVDITICNGETVSLSATATQGNNNYSYSWDNGLGTGATKSFTGTASSNTNNVTDYTVTVTDDIGCTATDMVRVTILSEPSATVSFADEHCSQADGYILVSFDNHPDQSQIEFSIDGGATYPYTIQDANSSFVIGNLSAGTFDLWARWGGGDCPVPIQSVTLNNSAGISLVTTPDEIICPGEGVLLTGTASSGTSPYLYTWDNGLGSGQSKTVYPSTTTTYNITATDNFGCTAIDDVMVTVRSNTDAQCSSCPDADADGDGVCASIDCDDNDPTLPLPDGTACNDGNALTTNDEIQEDGCTCAGDYIVCSTTLNISLQQPNYNNNGTPANLSDDTFTFDATIAGNGTSWTANGQTGTYGQTVTFGPYSVDAIGIVFDVLDQDNPNCRENISVNISSCIYSGICVCCN